mgnify:CR=1 FL=1
MHEPSIIVFPYVYIVPSELREPCVFLRMLQLLISYFAPDLQNQMQVYEVAMLSVNEEYDNEHVTEFESLKGSHKIPEKRWYLFWEILTDGQQIFPN